ncbi:NodT family efflux transporter outer membrane factor (OMF) lipoprotein [Vogesella indigofera]|uniref:NodT family efflux transporter outer membrane factor (OMF) lipoprotein n=1 Tax=Vogesella indigofera TaxID=45465 RepID=A0A495BCU8_VOGIN|nr:efflux transporter outer membrane subunit [Vogesella indigofera]RKQ58806.1 NodT family efflux transporter outer membrane factor (OMF) lipoprotein [Vogesella indigofera]
MKQHSSWRRRLSVLALALACSTTTLAATPGTADIPLQQDSWRAPAGQWHAPRSNAAWWQAFGSAELVQLIADARAANPELLAAQAAIAKAQAVRTQTAAGSLPQLNLSGSAQRQQGSSSVSLTPTLSYQLDWWGQQQALLAGDSARLVASVASRDAAALTLESEVARQYFSLLLLDEQQQLDSRRLLLLTQRLSLLQQQIRLGQTAPRDEAELVQTIATLQATLAAQRLELQQAYNALAVLCGKAPQDFRPQGSKLQALALPLPADIQPAALLQRRPDIRAADATLQALQGDVVAARAALYPTLTLSLQGVLSSAGGGPAQWLGSALASLAAPLFDGGKLKAGVALSEAQYQEQLQNWRSTVLAALQQADDALHEVASGEQGMQAQQAKLGAARRTEQIDSARYRLGALERGTLLETQANTLAAESAWLAARQAQLAATVTLYQALGGAPLAAEHDAA